MDDPLFMGARERVGNLARDVERLLYGKARALRRRARDPIRERLAFHEFQDKGADTVTVFDTVDAADVGMIQGGEYACLALEAGKAIGVRCELGG